MVLVKIVNYRRLLFAVWEKHYFYLTALIQTSASRKLNFKRKILLAVKNHHLLYFGHEKNVDQ